MKKILVPTDFSKHAGFAIQVALKIAKSIQAEIHFIHASHIGIEWEDMHKVSLSGHGELLPKYEEHLFPETREKLGKTRQALMDLVRNAEKEGAKATFYLVYGGIHENILAYADKLGVDLIIMGTHGSHGMKELFVGSNTQRIVRLANCPVITVKQEVSNFDIKKIVYAADFEDKGANANLGRLVEFAKLFKAAIHLLYVNTPSLFEDSAVSMKKMKQVAIDFGLDEQNIHIYNHSIIEGGIIEFAEDEFFDLVSLTTYGYKGLRRTLNDIIAEQVVNHCKIPVLTFNLS